MIASTVKALNQLQVQRVGNALFNLQVGSVTMDQVVSDIIAQGGDADATFNYYYKVCFGYLPTSQVADILVANFGIVAGQNGLTADLVSAARNYIIGQLDAVAVDKRGAVVNELTTLWAGLTGDATWGAAATAWNAEINIALAYTGAADLTAGTVPTSFKLTLGLDDVAGSSLNDTFTARIIDNSNTLQSGDAIDGGAGVDTLFADIGDSQNFAITPETVNVENLVFRAQANGIENASNNVAGEVKIDAERISGELRYENNNSRADLIIEDVRIADDQVTSDITIAMVSTDPGNVDFEVYFDQHSLRPDPQNTTNQIVLTIANQLPTGDGFDAANPLAEVPYTDLYFSLNGQTQQIELDLSAVTTYDELFAALQTALTNAGLAGTVTLAQLQDAYSFFSVDGEPRTGDLFTLTVNNGTIAPVTPGWSVDGGLDPDNAFSATVRQGESTAIEFLVTSTIVLDDVGRGSMGGNLIVGGLSTGLTSDSKGVEQFDITVIRNSELQTIDSTNNTLEVVNIVNDGTVNGSLVVENAFVDVRVIDASAMVGSVDAAVVLTGAVVDKYMDLFDTNFDPANDNVEFSYSFGQGDDAFLAVIDPANLANSFFVDNVGTTTREDFDLVIDGGAGNDELTLIIGDGDGNDGDHWYENSVLNANLVVNGGAGNDVIRTPGAGNVIINAGSGNDVVYTENTGEYGITGRKAVWAFNFEVDEDLDGDLDVDADDYAIAANLQNLLSDQIHNIPLVDTLDADTLFEGTVTVTFKGLVSTVTFASATNSLSDLQLNNLIKQAINGDAVLSTLLQASDGPANTLIVESLIDGVMAVNDLTVQILDENGDDVTDIDYASNFATFFGGAPYQGVAGSVASDNQVTLGLGNDVAVLGTGLECNDNVIYDAVGSGNDVIVNFAAAGLGIDTLDFTALTGASAAGNVSALFSGIDGSITIVAETIANDSAAEIKTLFDATFAEDAIASQHIYIAVDADNVGTAWLINDGTALFDSTVTLIGNIDLADTAWGALTAANFA